MTIRDARVHPQLKATTGIPYRAKGRFVKGESGNPGGREKSPWTLTGEFREYLKLHPEVRSAIVEAWGKLIQSKPEAMAVLLDRLEGRVPQAVMGSAGTVQVIVIYSSDVGRSSTPAPVIEIAGGTVEPTALMPAPTP